MNITKNLMDANAILVRAYMDLCRTPETECPAELRQMVLSAQHYVGAQLSAYLKGEN